MNYIFWPEEYIPGTTDNYCSNEVIVSGITSAEVWPYLSHPKAWPTYYANSSDIELENGDRSELAEAMRFRFKTFGFPIEAQVTEFVPPSTSAPARLAWHGWADGDSDTRLDVIHAWLIEDLSGGRVRILTQESQIGGPAKKLAKERPNPMINGHQDWLEGIVKAALEKLTF